MAALLLNRIEKRRRKSGGAASDLVTCYDTMSGNNIANMTITCVTTGEAKASSCTAVAFRNPTRTAQSYSTPGGLADDCGPFGNLGFDAVAPTTFAAGAVRIPMNESA